MSTNRPTDTLDERTAQTLERNYAAMLAANNAAEDRGQVPPNDLTTLREFLHSRGFSYNWLTRHGYQTEHTHGGRRPGAGPKRKSIKLSIDEIADLVYRECFGHLDDKRFHAEKLQKIRDWLGGYDATDVTIKSLANEWREYDSGNPNIR